MPETFTQVLAGTIDALPHGERVMLSLVYDRALTLAEVAAVLDVPLHTAAVRLTQMTRRLLWLLEHRWNTTMTTRKERTHAPRGADLPARA